VSLFFITTSFKIFALGCFFNNGNKMKNKYLDTIINLSAILTILGLLVLMILEKELAQIIKYGLILIFISLNEIRSTIKEYRPIVINNLNMKNNTGKELIVQAENE
jgi:hypothetical protein